MRLRERLNERCRLLMADGAWWSIPQLAEALRCTECGASARIRDQRKARYGEHMIERKRINGGLFAYRMLANENRGRNERE